jgi:hypothetical protein
MKRLQESGGGIKIIILAQLGIDPEREFGYKVIL